MNRKHITITSCVVTLVAGALYAGNRPTSGKKARSERLQAATQDALPEHVAYEFLFRRAAHFKQRAAQAGRPSAPDVTLQRETGLSEGRVRALGEIAASCLGEVAALDQRAQAVVNQFRSRLPDRVSLKASRCPRPLDKYSWAQRWPSSRWGRSTGDRIT
jgi:hypothetical protein